MLVTFSFTPPWGTTKNLLVLLDPGAQVNILRRGLLDPFLLHTIPQLVRLKVANGTPTIRGTEEATRGLPLWRSHTPHVDSLAEPVEYSDVFYQADISGYNLILGCPFMFNNSMGPLPHRRCLVIELADNLFYFLPRSQGHVSAVETTPRPLPPGVLPDRPPCWITRSYTIKLERLQEDLHHFGCPTPTVDSFASAANTKNFLARSTKRWHRI